MMSYLNNLKPDTKKLSSARTFTDDISLYAAISRTLFQYKDHLSRYGVSHDKDKTVLPLSWGSQYWSENIFISQVDQQK